MKWIIAHDAGGAEILSSWIMREKLVDQVSCVLEGPAKAVFSRKIQGSYSLKSRIDYMQQLQAGDAVITGSGLGSDLEFEAIRIAKAGGIKVATWIDHWVNYPQRFERNAVTLFPDELWVSDEFQEKLAHQQIPLIKTVLYPNPYFLDIQEQWTHMIQQDHASHNWLFIGEALSEYQPKYLNTPYDQLPEVQCFVSFLKMVKDKNIAANNIRIRPHPAEKKDKYLSALNACELNWEWSHESTLIEDCAWSDEVVGISSMGLVIALLGNKPVTSMKLHANWKCPIPWPGIRQI